MGENSAMTQSYIDIYDNFFYSEMFTFYYDRFQKAKYFQSKLQRSLKSLSQKKEQSLRRKFGLTAKMV